MLAKLSQLTVSGRTYSDSIACIIGVGGRRDDSSTYYQCKSAVFRVFSGRYFGQMGCRGERGW